jgi:hypothetical protein
MAKFWTYLPVTLRGKAFEPPPRTFRKLQIHPPGVSHSGAHTGQVPGWIKDFQHNLHSIPTGARDFQGIPFDVIALALNGDPTCIGLSMDDGQERSVAIPVHDRAASFYLLHAASGPELTVGTFTIHYSDGSEHSEYVQQGKNIGSSWEARDSKYNREGPRIDDMYRIAWQDAPHGMVNMGVYAAGFNNPYPERAVESLILSTGIGNSKWLVLAATLSDAPVFFGPYDDLSTGIPDGWNAGIAWAIFEGLAGVKDAGAAFNRSVLAPRWEAVGVKRAEVTVRYLRSKVTVLIGMCESTKPSRWNSLDPRGSSLLSCYCPSRIRYPKSRSMAVRFQ